MKSPKPKSSTLADFIKRGADAEVEASSFHDDPDAIESLETTLERHELEANASKKSGEKKRGRRPRASKSVEFAPELDRSV